MPRTAQEYYRNLAEDGVVLFFNGPVSQRVVEDIGSMIRDKVAGESRGMQTARKVFAVLVEQLQNIICYSLESVHASYGAGQIIVRREEQGYCVACSNLMRTDKARRIQEKVAVINAMSREELKAYYKQQRRAGPDACSMGAGLGFIEMARKASKPLDIEFHPYDDATSVFSVAVSI